MAKRPRRNSPVTDAADDAALTLINTTLSTLSLGDEITFRNLTMFAVGSELDPDLLYDTLDWALDAGSLTVSELTDDGHVPEIKVANGAHGPFSSLTARNLWAPSRIAQ